MSPDDREELEAVIEGAYELLWRFHVTDGPVPVEAIAGELGVEVLRARLTTGGCCGVLAYLDDRPVILVRSQDSRMRQRFTIAHELYHLLKGAEPRHICKDFTLGGECQPWEERKANRFAAELLMPANWIRALLHQSYTIDGIMAYLQVSRAALRTRFDELGIPYFPTAREWLGA